MAEFFYEYHHSDPAMAAWFGAPPTPYPAALRTLARLRAAGVLAHAWP